MNVVKRLEALEKVAARKVENKIITIVLRQLVANETEEEPMNFVTCQGQLFERGGNEPEVAFMERIEMGIVARFGTDKVYLAVGSVERMDCNKL